MLIEHYINFYLLGSVVFISMMYIYLHKYYCGIFRVFKFISILNSKVSNTSHLRKFNRHTYGKNESSCTFLLSFVNRCKHWNSHVVKGNSNVVKVKSGLWLHTRWLGTKNCSLFLTNQSPDLTCTTFQFPFFQTNRQNWKVQ